MQQWFFFVWESIANFFEEAPLGVHKEIIYLEEKEFRDQVYFSDLELEGSILKWV